MSIQHSKIQFTEAKKIVERRLPSEAIKERKIGGTTLKYIGGSTVIRLLNEAFDYNWSFQIISTDIIESVPKAITVWENGKKVTAKNSDGTPKMEAQAPYIQVLGRLTIPGDEPGTGIVKEQYGTKILLGGASEQEGAAKSAGTDALKKCATMLGIGLELYEDDAPSEAPSGDYQKGYNTKPSYNKGSYNNNYQKKEAPSIPALNWTTPEIVKEVDRIQVLMADMGLKDSNDLDPFVQTWLKDPKATKDFDVTPENIKEFNNFFEKIVEEEKLKAQN